MKILFGMRDDGDMTEPMNIMLLSALAKKRGHRVGLWVMERDNLRETIRRENPDIAAFSCITGSQHYYIDAARQAKELNPKIITAFGGPHFTFFPAEIFNNPNIDFLCVGEGYDAWPDALGALENNESLDGIPNIVTQGNARTVLKVTSELVRLGKTADLHNIQGSFDQYTLSGKHIRPRREDLDSLPFMDRALIYDNTEFRYRYKRTMMASHGCPFRCAYCFQHQSRLLYQELGKIRCWLSVDRFLDELDFVRKNWDTRFFKFYDDVFPPFPNDAEIAWHQEFCRKYPARIGLPFHILTRCDLVIRLQERGVDVLSDWKKSGLASITMSIESGNKFVRDHVITRRMSVRKIVGAFKLARAAAVNTFPNTILGIPAPIIPYSDDPQFDGKMKRVAEEIEMLQRINGVRINLSTILKIAEEWSLDEYERKEFVVKFLESLGLCHSYIDYNIGSVKFTLDQRPSFAEFANLYPYPKTRATQWCIARGDFDGDFDKLHASYQTTSPLACHSEYDKAVIQNLSLLGTFLSFFAGSRNPLMYWLSKPLRWLFIDHLSKIDRPWATKVYLWLYTVSKAYMHRTRIYPMKFSLAEKLRFYSQMIRLDFWKQTRKKSRPEPKRAKSSDAE